MTVKILTTSAAAISICLLMLAGFQGWLDHGATLLLAMAESGMSWCF